MNTNKTRAEKALDTKLDTLKQKYCLNCGMGIIRNGTQGRKRFCNDACKQSHYRWRKSLDPKPVQRTYDRTAQQMINVAWAHLADVETALGDEERCTYCGYEETCRTIYSDAACTEVSSYVCDQCYDAQIVGAA